MEKNENIIIAKVKNAKNPTVSIVMGSKSDFETMQHTILKLDYFKIPYEVKVVSAHRTPHFMYEYASSLEKRGVKIIIAGAGGAAHLPGMMASISILPVIGVPVKSKVLKGIDSLLSIVQMPSGVPVATVAIGQAGAENAAILAAQILSLNNEELKKKIALFRKEKEKVILNEVLE